MSPNLTFIENIRQLLKLNLRRKKIKRYQSLVSAIEREWEFLPSELTIKLVHIMNDRISELYITLVIRSFYRFFSSSINLVKLEGGGTEEIGVQYCNFSKSFWSYLTNR